MSTSRFQAMFWMLLFRASLLLALAASAALTLDYVNPTGAFCASGSGCDEVRQSAYAQLFGLLPVPLLGILGFASLLAVSLIPNQRFRSALLAPLTIAGAAVAVLLIAIQVFDIGALCWLCMVTDIAALVAMLALAGRHYFAREFADGPEEEALRVWAWGGLGAVAIVAPLLWPQIGPQGALPETLTRFHVSGRVNIIEFADFQCPHCRVLHVRLKAILANEPEDINLVRLNAPLESHEHARGAARAAICAESQDKGDAMADALFETEDLTRAGIARAAATLHLDTDLFDHCLADPATDRQIDSERAILDSVGFQGLPTLFIGRERIVGAQPEAVLRPAIAKARGGDEGTSIPLSGYLAVLVGIAALVVFFGRSPTPDPPAPAKQASFTG